MTNLHTTTTNINVPRSLAHPLVNFSLMSPKLVWTYLRIVGNWELQWHYYFWDWYSWKSLAQSIENSHFCLCKNHHVTSFQIETNQTPKRFVKLSSLTIILIDWGGPFNFINHKDDGAIVFPWYFMWIIELWWHRWKNLLSINAIHKNSSQWNRSHYEVALCQKKKRYFQNFKSFSKSFELFKYDFITALPPLCIVGYWLLRNFLNQYQINLLPTHPPPYDVFCILFMIFFVCCLFVTMMFNIACLKQDYLWFLGKPNYSIFDFENLFFFSSLFHCPPI